MTVVFSFSLGASTGSPVLMNQEVLVFITDIKHGLMNLLLTNMRSRINATNGVVDFIRSEPMGGMACIRGRFERCGQGCYMDTDIGNFLFLLFIFHFVLLSH